MKKLQNQIEYDINKLNYYFNNNNQTFFEDYRETAEILIDIASDNGIYINYPKRLNEELKNEDTNLRNIQKEMFENNFNNMKSFNNSISKLYNKINIENNYYYNKYQVKMLQKDTIKIVSKFYQNFDKDISDYFEDLITSNKVFFTKHILDYLTGLTIEAIEDIKAYIFVTKKYTIVDAITLAHETIHAYLSEQLKNMTINEKNQYITNNIYEVYPFFIELVFLNYLQKNNFNIKDINKYITIYNYILSDNLYSLNTIINNKDFDLNNEIDVESFNENQGYSYGGLFAYHFYNQYHNDKDEAKDNIYNFMTDAKDYDLNHLINNYGLNEKELSKCKILKKTIKLFDR